MRLAVACAMLVTALHAWAQDESLAPRLLQANQLKVSVEQVALQRQYDALRSMTLEAVEYSPRGPITSVVGQTGIVLPADTSLRQKGATATDILPTLKDVLLATGSESLKVQENSVFYGAEKTLELAQSIRGIPVINGVVSMSYNGNTGAVSSITAHFIPDRGLPRKAELSAEQAKEIVGKALATKQTPLVSFDDDAYLAYFADFGDPEPPHLVWAIRAVTKNSDDILYVDSITGQIVARTSMRMELTRKVYDMNNSILANFPQGLPAELNTNQINSQLYRSTPYYSMNDADTYLRSRIPDSIPYFQKWTR